MKSLSKRRYLQELNALLPAGEASPAQDGSRRVMSAEDLGKSLVAEKFVGQDSFDFPGEAPAQKIKEKLRPG